MIEVGGSDGGCGQANPETASADYRANLAGTWYRVRPSEGGLRLPKAPSNALSGGACRAGRPAAPSSALGSAAVSPHPVAVRTLLPDDPPIGRPYRSPSSRTVRSVPKRAPVRRGADEPASDGADPRPQSPPGPLRTVQRALRTPHLDGARIPWTRNDHRKHAVEMLRWHAVQHSADSVAARDAPHPEQRPRIRDAPTLRKETPVRQKGRTPHGKQRKRREADIAHRISGVAPGPPIPRRRAPATRKPHAAFEISYAKA